MSTKGCHFGGPSCAYADEVTKRQEVEKMSEYQELDLELIEDALGNTEDYSNPEKGITRVEAICAGIEQLTIEKRRLRTRLGEQANEIKRLRKALQFYADEDARDVEACILETVYHRPATAALEVKP